MFAAWKFHTRLSHEECDEIIRAFSLQDCEEPDDVANVCAKIKPAIHFAIKRLAIVVAVNVLNQWETTFQKCIEAHFPKLSEAEVKAASEFALAVILRHVHGLEKEADQHHAKGVHYCELSLISYADMMRATYPEYE